MGIAGANFIEFKNGAAGDKGPWINEYFNHRLHI